MINLRFHDTTIEVHDDHTMIYLPSGATVPGAPEDTDGYRATAHRYGYGEDTLQLCKDHEVMHVALSDWLGLPISPTMHFVSTGDDSEVALRGLEEAAVLAIQRYARAAGIDLIAHFAVS